MIRFDEKQVGAVKIVAGSLFSKRRSGFQKRKNISSVMESESDVPVTAVTNISFRKIEWIVLRMVNVRFIFNRKVSPMY